MLNEQNMDESTPILVHFLTVGSPSSHSVFAAASSQ